MFTEKISGKSKSAILKTAVALLAVLFLVIPGTGLLNIGTSQALAHDDGDDDRWDGKRHHKADACAETSEAALTACKFAAQENYNLALGTCKNVAKNEQGKCNAKAKDVFRSDLAECPEQFDARQEVCEAIGRGPYLPEGIPDGFADDPLGNEYFPLEPGTIYTYKNYDADDLIQETIVVKVEGDNMIREIEGVKCRSVQDTVYEGNGDDPEMKIEDTTDWFALRKGDVWYFGEIALNYEDGVISNIDGSWTAGVEGAKPGIVMFADPLASEHQGETYRQEFALSEAEDDAKIIGFVQFGGLLEDYPILSKLPTDLGITEITRILHTEDFSALEPGVVEDKYYAPGVGNILIVELDPDTGEVEAMEVLVEKVGP